MLEAAKLTGERETPICPGTDGDGAILTPPETGAGATLKLATFGFWLVPLDGDGAVLENLVCDG